MQSSDYKNKLILIQMYKTTFFVKIFSNKVQKNIKANRCEGKRKTKQGFTGQGHVVVIEKTVQL